MGQRASKKSINNSEEGNGAPLDMHQSTNPSINAARLPFKAKRSLEIRKRDVEEISKKHPDKVPIVIERAKNEKALPPLDKVKFLVPEEVTMGQLTLILRRRLQLLDSQTFYILVNNRTLVPVSTTLAEVYRSQKDVDGFLYVNYAAQETFG